MPDTDRSAAAGADAFTPADRDQLAAHGIAPAEAARQLAVLAVPPGFARLDRPCTVGDGIEQWDAARRDRLVALAAEAAAAGRLSSFVPASGAATRMFKDLLAWRSRPGELPAGDAVSVASDDAEARAVAAWWDGLERFAFWPALRAGVGVERDDTTMRPWLDGLLGDGGLGYASLPKGLLAFHRSAGGVRTAVEEQLADAAALVAAGASSGRPADGLVGRVHLTVSPEHRGAFERCVAEARGGLEADAGVTVELTMSEQDPATDTIAGAVGEPGSSPSPFRTADGHLVFRPAGHGALIGNLARCGGDFVLLKNIDNVATGAAREATVAWARALFGRLGELVAERDRLLGAIDGSNPAGSSDGFDVAAGRAWLASSFGLDVDGSAATVREALDRPVRVAGMVANTGEPGGGPFWVRGRDGAVTRQIVESAEVDAGDAAQTGLLQRSTHFNPVFLAVALRDRRGDAYDLDRFVDPDAVITTRKSSGGRELAALERPGLWNGAMARWNTVFVEVPLDVFNPVKTVLDLLRPAHQPAV